MNWTGGSNASFLECADDHQHRCDGVKMQGSSMAEQCEAYAVPINESVPGWMDQSLASVWQHSVEESLPPALRFPQMHFACADHSAGVQCAFCEPGTHAAFGSGDSPCVPCGPRWSQTTLAAVGVLLVVALVTGYVLLNDMRALQAANDTKHGGESKATGTQPRLGEADLSNIGTVAHVSILLDYFAQISIVGAVFTGDYASTSDSSWTNHPATSWIMPVSNFFFSVGTSLASPECLL